MMSIFEVQAFHECSCSFTKALQVLYRCSLQRHNIAYITLSNLGSSPLEKRFYIMVQHPIILKKTSRMFIAESYCLNPSPSADLGLETTLTPGAPLDMGRKRPRPFASAQLLLVAFASHTRAFVQRPVSHGPGFTNSRCRQQQPSAGEAIAANANSMLGKDSPSDPLPRTMEELYQQMRVTPPMDPYAQYNQEPSAEDMKFIEEAIRCTCKPMEDDKWWEEHGEEWDLAIQNPEKLFGSVTTGDEDIETLDFDMSGEPWGLVSSSFSLGLYKRGGQGDANLGLTPFAQYWDSLPDLHATKRIYAYNAVDRMAALKYLMKCTSNGMYGSEENHQAGHFLWGYMDQLDWMSRSGRLAATPGVVRVDRNCWWGHVSFALTVVPLAAAIQSEILGDKISIIDADELQHPLMLQAVRAWRRVWGYADPMISARLRDRMPVHDVLQEGFRRAQWVAHTESLNAVRALYGHAFDALPSSEREFASGWCRAARLMSAAAAPTNLEKLIYPLGAGYLPEVVLGEGEPPKGIHLTGHNTTVGAKLDDALERYTRRCVGSIRWLGTLPAPAFAALVFLWSRACVSYTARRGAVRVLRHLCCGGVRDRVAAVARSIVFMFVPDVNYRKLTPPLGIDPAEEVEYDPNYRYRDPNQPVPVPLGHPPLNPLQRPWYTGPRPQLRDEGPLEDDDDGFGGPTGLFPYGTEPPDLSLGGTNETGEPGGA